MEIPHGNDRFTWSREGASVVRLVLDRFVINKAWDDEFENIRASRQACLFSDHFPLFLEAGSDFATAGCSTKTDLAVERAWINSGSEGWAYFVLNAKLRRVELAVKDWVAEF